MCVVAVLGSLMVSYTRARAEALGVECKVGLATRPVRVVILSIGLVFAKGAGIGDFNCSRRRSTWSPALTILTVFQRVWHVRNELTRIDEDSAAEDERRRGGCVTRNGAGCLPTQRDPRRNQRTMSESNGTNGAAARRKVRVAIIGVGNCANSFVQGVQYYKDADPAEERPRPDARRPRRLPHPRRRIRRRLRHRQGEGRQGPLRGDLVRPEQHDQVRRGAATSASPSSAA